MEASIRIFQPGINISQKVRVIQLHGNKLNNEQLERVCSNLRNIYGLGAIPHERSGNAQSILVISNRSLNGIRVKEGNWLVTLTDRENYKTLKFIDQNEREDLTDLVVRAVYGKLEKSDGYQRMDTPKIWYDHEPLTNEGDIVAYRRYSVSGIPIDNEGIGVGLHVETAFFTNKTVQYYHVTNQIDRFNHLTSRQEGSKGTLLYKLGRKRLKCYFVEYCDGMTCATTGKLSFDGQTFENLYDYYTKKYPDLKFNPNDKVAKVSFDGNLSSGVPVSANMLFVRIMNDALPASLKRLDKIVPFKRKQAEAEFWLKISESPVSNSSLRIRTVDWQPGSKSAHQLPLPSILFNQNKTLCSPSSRNKHSYNKYYQDIKQLLDEVGCYHVPANIPRVIIFPFPQNIPESLRKRVSTDIVNKISRLTGKEIKAEILTYQFYSEVFLQLKNVPHGMVFFTMTNDPAIYYDIESELKRFDIKRLTEKTLFEQAEFLNKNRISRWNSFIDLCAYDIVVQMRCIPYLPELSSYYDAMLVMDVGDKSKFFGVSLLINKIEGRKLIPIIVSNTHYKADSKISERINERQLETRIIDAFNDAKKKARFLPMNRMLVVRDGKICGNEQSAVEAAHKSLIRQGVLTGNSVVDLIDLHKTSVKEIRLTHTSNGFIDNVLEGSAVVLDNKNIVLATTGAGTLKMGTANPLMLETKMNLVHINNLEVVKYLFNSCLFNFFSPTVAQRLPFPVKELDDKLKIKLLQHIPVRG
ncbi:MAG: hypothetical protein JST75_09570 [Bacteroidetes bacterium]|nr:hypothetical protein [Bacteroidota bacterium]